MTLQNSVVIDDTNLNEGTVQSWKDLAAEIQGTHIEYRRIETPLEECIARDAARPNSVGKTVIVNMALQYGLYPAPKKAFVICDIDGTLADISHRLHFVRKSEAEQKDWKGFFESMSGDTVRQDVLALVAKEIAEGHDIVFVSGRPDTYRTFTEKFCFGAVPEAVTVLMRPAFDKRSDTEVKQDIYKRFLSRYPVAKVIDDRPSVIRMWKENGLEVIDVGSGVEF